MTGITIFIVSCAALNALVLSALAFAKKIDPLSISETILFLGSFSLIVGLFGYVQIMYIAAKSGIIFGNSFFAVITTVVDSHEQSIQIANVFSGGSLIIMATMLVVAICAILWQMLNHLKLKE